MQVTSFDDGGFVVDNPDRAVIALMVLRRKLNLEITLGMSSTQTLAHARGWGERLGCDDLAGARTRKQALKAVERLCVGRGA